MRRHFLFGSLAMKMRNVEYQYGLNDSSGLMSFRVSLPFNKKENWKIAAADGQMGTIMKVYREWQLSGDDAFLRKIWPGVKKALAFAWIKGGWDADQDGVMEGCQHNTMDIEYFGPNPEIEFWYLGALKAASRMAEYLNDREFQQTCSALFEKGSQWTDQHLFNGEFYIQQIRPVAGQKHDCYRTDGGHGCTNLKNPDFQIGEGCLVDQLVGQNMAWICGLGYLADSSHISGRLWKAFRNIIMWIPSEIILIICVPMHWVTNPGLMLTSYPDPSKRPAVPLSYAFEAWTGLEYTAATGMIYENMNRGSTKHYFGCPEPL